MKDNLDLKADDAVVDAIIKRLNTQEEISAAI